MSADLRTRKRLERLRRQADALLDLTQAINRNVPDGELFGSYRRVLSSLGAGKLALFCRDAEDESWSCAVEWDYPAKLPKLEDADAVGAGASAAHALQAAAEQAGQADEPPTAAAAAAAADAAATVCSSAAEAPASSADAPMADADAPADAAADGKAGVFL